MDEAETDSYALKWAVIALHHATHCFMLIALQNPDGSGIWYEEIRREDGQIDVFHEKIKLVSFKTAFEWIQDSTRMGGYIDAKPFKALPYHWESLQHLNDELRNQFIHFKPVGWSLSSRYVVDVMGPVLEVIEFVVVESGRFRIEEDRLLPVRDIINEIRHRIPRVVKEDLNLGNAL